MRISSAKNRIVSEKEVYKEAYDFFSNYKFLLGVNAPKAERKGGGVTNAELMFIHERGSLARHIPARPVLQYTIDDMRETVDEFVRVASLELLSGKKTKDQIIIDMKRLAIKIQSHAYHIIYDNTGRLAENSEGVKRAKRKKNRRGATSDGNHPLFDTGQLARSIVCYLATKDGTKV